MDLSKEEEELISKLRSDKITSEWKPRCDYTTAQKCDLFDSLWKMAKEHYIDTKENGPREDDAKRWMFEAVMELLGKDVWKTYNEFCR